MAGIRFPVLVFCVFVLGCQSEAPTQDPVEVSRPQFTLTTTEAYDFSTIEDYDGEHVAIYKYIDANIDAHLQAIQRWLRQPSVSAQNIGVLDMANGGLAMTGGELALVATMIIILGFLLGLIARWL